MPSDIVSVTISKCEHAETKGKMPHNSRDRWGLLRRALLINSSATINGTAAPLDAKEALTIGSVEKSAFFQSLFGHVSVSTHSESDDSDPTALSISTVCYPVSSSECGTSRELRVSIPSRRVLPSSLFSAYSGHLNTGNVRIWSSEHVLAFWASREANAHLFRDRRVLEIGAGMSGFAGLMLATTSKPPRSIHITDGNPQSVSTLHRNIEQNINLFSKTLPTASQLMWGPMTDQYDVIIGGDCSFNRDSHAALIQTMQEGLIFPDGVAVFFCPQRGGTLTDFVRLCKTASFSISERGEGTSKAGKRSRFDVEVFQQFDHDVWRMHQEHLKESDNYVEDKEYPTMLSCDM
ncbi:putative methyltransferase-domain-containing protein [Chytriomyces sp. MP71]|nr:putative methyltransferase-domain-containing protein [Chytriomyces sp. MP71]